MESVLNTLDILKRELKSYFESPVAYVFLIVFLMLVVGGVPLRRWPSRWRSEASEGRVTGLERGRGAQSATLSSSCGGCTASWSLAAT